MFLYCRIKLRLTIFYNKDILERKKQTIKSRNENDIVNKEERMLFFPLFLFECQKDRFIGVKICVWSIISLVGGGKMVVEVKDLLLCVDYELAWL